MLMYNTYLLDRKSSTKRGSGPHTCPVSSDDQMGREEELQQKAPRCSSDGARSPGDKTEAVLSESWSRQQPLDMSPDGGAQQSWLNDGQGTSCQQLGVDQNSVLAVSQSPTQPRQERRKHQRGPLGFHSGLRPHCVHPNHQPLS